ncbi:ABC transporter permease [Metabacillus sp. DBTR6]|uniref:Transport permease protein n=1 Tax=Metabacillus rhizolycopersici TaxID=2875709 RepID=A0ABS7V108_9BACI|nr:ABC transporter permease [Metabacillus rhizolycopersici]
MGVFAFLASAFRWSGLTKSAGAASGFAMVIFFPMLFLSGIAMPVEILPQFLQDASKWLPMTHFVELAQGVWNGDALTVFGLELLILTVFGLVCVVLAFLLFRWEN